MFRFSLLIFMLFALAPFKASSLTCVEDNHLKCKELGYTLKRCLYGPGIACPYDRSLWYCPTYTCEDGRYQSSNDLTYWTTCERASFLGNTCYDCKCITPTKDCALGDVFYHDGTCSATYGSCVNKIPVGVVYMLTDASGNIVKTKTSRYGRVISLVDLDQSLVDNGKTIFGNDFGNPSTKYFLPWGLGGTPSVTSGHGVTVAHALSNHLQKMQELSTEGTSLYYDGNQATTKLLSTTPTYAKCQNGEYDSSSINFIDFCTPTAARVVKNFAPSKLGSSNSIAIRGKWYLPSVGELLELYQQTLDGATSTEYTISFANTAQTNTIINQTLNDLLIKGINTMPLGDKYYSSNDFGTYDVWTVSKDKVTHTSPNKLHSYNYNAGKARIRASLKFDNSK